MYCLVITVTVIWFLQESFSCCKMYYMLNQKDSDDGVYNAQNCWLHGLLFIVRNLKRHMGQDHGRG